MEHRVGVEEREGGEKGHKRREEEGRTQRGEIRRERGKNRERRAVSTEDRGEEESREKRVGRGGHGQVK